MEASDDIPGLISDSVFFHFESARFFANLMDEVLFYEDRHLDWDASPWPPPLRACAHFLVDGKDLTESGRDPEKGLDPRRRYEATAGRSGKHGTSRAAPTSSQNPESALFVAATLQKSFDANT
jgi:hypothetical protein